MPSLASEGNVAAAAGFSLALMLAAVTTASEVADPGFDAIAIFQAGTHELELGTPSKWPDRRALKRDSTRPSWRPPTRPRPGGAADAWCVEEASEAEVEETSEDEAGARFFLQTHEGE